MALIGELNKEESLRRSASCVSDYNTLVIGVPKQDYIHILLEMMQNDIHGKAMFFSQLIIFQGVDQYSLIPLAANIEPNTYKINQIILNAGEQPQGLYIIYKGNCKVIWEGYLLRKKNGNRVVISKAPKKITVNQTFQSNSQRSRLSTNISDILNTEEIENAAKYLKTDNIHELLKEYDLFKKINEIRKLKPGDFFGSRAVTNEAPFENARYSIISDDCEVKVFIIALKQFSLIPERHLVYYI